MDKQASLTCICCDRLAIIEGSYKCCNTDDAGCLNEKPFEPKNLPLKILKVKWLGPGWRTVREHSEPRNIYKDPFMQHVRDKSPSKRPLETFGGRMTEIAKLESLIREKHPDWNIEVSDLHDGRKIVLLDGKGNYVCDVVCHSYSYGGKVDLLEWWNCKKKTDPIGWLTAERALVGFEESLKGKEKPLEGKA